MTPACGDTVAAFAEDEMQNSMSPDLHELEHLRLLAELRARILVDQHRALGEVLQLVGEDVADDAVAGCSSAGRRRSG